MCRARGNFRVSGRFRALRVSGYLAPKPCTTLPDVSLGIEFGRMGPRGLGIKFGHIWSGVWRSQPPPHGLVRGGGGGGGWRVRRGVGAVGAAAGETARRHRQGRHSTQALRKAINPIT